MQSQNSGGEYTSDKAWIQKQYNMYMEMDFSEAENVSLICWLLFYIQMEDKGQPKNICEQ